MRSALSFFSELLLAVSVPSVFSSASLSPVDVLLSPGHQSQNKAWNLHVPPSPSPCCGVGGRCVLERAFRGSASDRLHSTHLVILGALAASILFAESVVAHTVQQLWKVPAGVVFPVVTVHKNLSQLC